MVNVRIENQVIEGANCGILQVGMHICSGGIAPRVNFVAKLQSLSQPCAKSYLLVSLCL
jgi:hypothetical protein